MPAKVQAGPHTAGAKMPHMVQDMARPGQMLPRVAQFTLATAGVTEAPHSYRDLQAPSPRALPT